MARLWPTSLDNGYRAATHPAGGGLHCGAVGHQVLGAVTVFLAWSAISASAQDSRAARWMAPEGSRTRLAFDSGVGIHPAPMRWWVVDSEVDSEPGLMVRTSFGLNLYDRTRPVRTFGSLAIGWRWWRKLELGATALLVSGREIGTTSPRFIAGGPGFYFGVGVSDGLRISFVIGNAYGPANAVVLQYRAQVPVVVTDTFRLLVVARGYFSWPRPVISVHRLQLEAIVERQWKVFAGAIFDGGDGSTMGGPSVGASIGLILGLGVQTP